MPIFQLEDLFASADRLPAAPQVFPRLQNLLRDGNSTLEDIAELIRLDASLAARVVRLSNSAFYGGSERSTTIDGAVSRLGFREVNKVVSALSALQVMVDALPSYGLKKGELWGISLRTALLMEALADETGGDAGTAYTVGLLHAIGKILINRFAQERDIQIYEDAEEGVQLTPEMERQLLGFDFAEIGASLLERWKIPSVICDPVRYQMHPQVCPSGSELPTLLALAISARPLIDAGSLDLPTLAEDEQTDDLPAASIVTAIENVRGQLQGIVTLFSKV
ncbi:MAG: HDOD domain-containing protein [Verrucomicrobiota bacterium]